MKRRATDTEILMMARELLDEAYTRTNGLDAVGVLGQAYFAAHAAAFAMLHVDQDRAIDDLVSHIERNYIEKFQDAQKDVAMKDAMEQPVGNA